VGAASERLSSKDGQGGKDHGGGGGDGGGRSIFMFSSGLGQYYYFTVLNISSSFSFPNTTHVFQTPLLTMSVINPFYPIPYSSNGYETDPTTKMK
jgi:hypothetical protein